MCTNTAQRAARPVVVGRKNVILVRAFVLQSISLGPATYNSWLDTITASYFLR